MKKELVALLLLSGCGGSFVKKEQMANSHYRQASLDVKEYQDTKNISTLRKALNEVDQAVALCASARILGLKATILLQLGQLAESKTLFERIINDKKFSRAKRADAKNNYATVLYQMGDTVQAQRIWLELANDPHYVSPEVAYFNLGYSELNEARKIEYQEHNQLASSAIQHVEQAVAYFKSSLAIAREYVDALFFLGHAYIILNKLTDARDCFVTILTINLEHTAAQAALRSLEIRLAQQPLPVTDAKTV